MKEIYNSYITPIKPIIVVSIFFSIYPYITNLSRRTRYRTADTARTAMLGLPRQRMASFRSRDILGLYRGYMGIMAKKMETTII